MTERFTLLTELGRGGMGVVWKARDEELGQIVALKLLREAYAEDPDYVTRFERELDLAKRIHSRNVVQVLGYGVRDGTPYLVLEYVDGPSLRQHLTTHGAYAWPEAKVLCAQIAQGLADAHAAGVIHRDLKPSNILIGSDGIAKLADFGIAKGLDLTRVTGTSTLLGTPAYLPPEGPADERSDLYSLGVIAYELLTGVVPFEGRTYQEVILRHVREAPNLDKLPKESRQIVGRLLAKDPKRRPQRADELVAVLEQKRKVALISAMAPSDVAVAPIPQSGSHAPPTFERQRLVGRQSESRRQMVALGVLALLVVLVVIGSAVLASGSTYVPSQSGTTGPTQTNETPQTSHGPDGLQVQPETPSGSTSDGASASPAPSSTSGPPIAPTPQATVRKVTPTKPPPVYIPSPEPPYVSPSPPPYVSPSPPPYVSPSPPPYVSPSPPPYVSPSP
jgi:serine/threonine protein kinase